jgi:DNA-binding transcriptional MocR family regulator
MMFAFARVPREAVTDSRLTAGEFRVLAAIAARIDNETNACFVSVTKLCADLAAHARTIQRAIQKLEELGYLTVQERRRSDGSSGSNRYRINGLAKPKKTEGTPVSAPGGTPAPAPGGTPVSASQPPRRQHRPLFKTYDNKTSNHHQDYSGRGGADPYQALLKRITTLTRISEAEAWQMLMKDQSATNAMVQAQAARTLTDHQLIESMHQLGRAA